MAVSWVARGNLTGPEGPEGPAGDDGVSITDAEINGSGDLIITLSTAAQINAGRAQGLPGGGIDFESSVPTVGDLPTDDEFGTARFVVADGHLYVYEEDAGPGWTDVGPIRGEAGSTGPAGADGADGVSVTGATIDGSGHLILTLSAGGPIDAGVAKGADGAQGDPGVDGADGADGVRGSQWLFYDTTPPSLTGVLPGDWAFDPASGEVLQAVDV